MTQHDQLPPPPGPDPWDRPAEAEPDPVTPSENRHADLWSEHVADLTRFATVIVGPHDAHDVVSIAFHRVTHRLDDGHEINNLRAYLMRTITNIAADQHRSRQRQQARDLRAAVGRPNTIPEPTAPDVDLRRAVADLSVQQRAAIYFTYWEDLDSRQVAQLLDIAPATVRRHLARARHQLRKELS